MNRFCWWIAGLISRALEPAEREAVFGDFAESAESVSAAVCQLLGLVIRRKAVLWTDWRPWLALVGLVGPVGVSSRCWTY